MAADQHWTLAEALTFPPSGSQQVALAASSDLVHLVWVEAKTLYHSLRTNGAWQPPVKIAGGEQPVLAVAPDGTLCCAYDNWFLGNRDIYFSSWANGKWSLSQVVSRTTGESSEPTICVAPDGSVHLAWADTTPGYSTIYHGARDPGGWTYAPVPNGRGSRPSISANVDAIYVAWQDRPASSATGAFEVLVTSKRGSEWSLPEMVSDTREAHSILPQIAAGAQGRCHLVWQEQNDELYVIKHSDLWPNGWEAPADVSDPAADSRLARVAANPLGIFQFLWSEGDVLKYRVRAGEPQGSWWEPEIPCDECSGMDELAIALSPGGELHAVLTRWPDGGDPQLFYLRRKALERKKVFMPVVTK